jgi:hypothetical protein
MSVTLRNPETGELRKVKIGWSWICFLFSGVFGLPLFLRGLDLWGVFMAGFCLLNLLLGVFVYSPAIFLVLCTAALGLQIFFGMKANEITAKNYLKRGWAFVDAESEAVRLAKAKWKITQSSGSTPR